MNLFRRLVMARPEDLRRLLGANVQRLRGLDRDQRAALRVLGGPRFTLDEGKQSWRYILDHFPLGCGSIVSSSKPHDFGDLIGCSSVGIGRLRVASAA